jgi:hypothetical protein
MEKYFDYYTGFEGDRLYIFTISWREVICKLDIWSGYIHKILYNIPLGENGIYEGLPLHDTIGTGCYAEDVWTMPEEEIVISIKQFEQLYEEGIFEEHYERVKEILKVLKELFEIAYTNKGVITIEFA